MAVPFVVLSSAEHMALYDGGQHHALLEGAGTTGGGGFAIDGADFTVLGGPQRAVVFGAGGNSSVVALSVATDGAPEFDERLALVLLPMLAVPPVAAGAAVRVDLVIPAHGDPAGAVSLGTAPRGLRRAAASRSSCCAREAALASAPCTGRWARTAGRTWRRPQGRSS